jgi:hypothetical protein
MPVKVTTTGADLYKESKKVLQGLDIPTQKVAELVRDGARSIVGGNSDVSSPIFNDVKNITNRYVKTHHCFIHNENLCVKSLKMTDVFTLVSKLNNFVMPKE